jgi:hypothetical protein
MSLSSSSLILVELFFLVLGFFGAGAFRFVFPPRVALPMRAFSSACNLAAKAASSSSSLTLVFLTFFLGGATSSTSDSADSSPGGDGLLWETSEVSSFEVFAPFSTVGMGSETSDPPFCSLLNLSNRCIMSVVICSCLFVSVYAMVYHVELQTFCLERSFSTLSCRPFRMRFAEMVLMSLARRISSMMTE